MAPRWSRAGAVRRAARSVLATVGVGAVAAAGLVAFSVPAHAATTSYNWPGSHQFTVPAGVTTLSVVVKGANGGGGFSSTGVVNNGGQGAKLSGSVDVTAGMTVYLWVGGNGADGRSGSVGGGGGGYSSISRAIGARPLVVAGAGGGGTFAADGVTSRPGGNGGVAGSSSGGGRGGYQFDEAANGGLGPIGGAAGGDAAGRGGGNGSAGDAAPVDGGAGGGGFGGAGGSAGILPNEGGGDSGGDGSTGGGGGGGYAGGGGGDGWLVGGVTGAGGGGSSYPPDVTTEATTTTEAPFISITYTIPKQDQTISFPPVPDLALSAGRVLLGADASSFLPVTYTSGTPSVCTISTDEAVLVSAGTCTIYADQAGSESYNAAPQVSQSFTVVPDAVVPSPSPDPVADRTQSAPACGTAPRKVARRGTTRLLGANCRTDAGQSITVQISLKRKDKKHARLIRARGGAVSVKTDGTRIRLAVAWTAGATTGYLPYSVSRAYRT